MPEPTLEECAPLALLADAMKGAVLVESGYRWVKVHGVEDAEALRKLLEAALLVAERA